VVLVAVADTNYRFVYVDIGSYGKDCDFTIFKRSALWTSVQTIMLGLSSEISLSGTAGAKPYFCVGDDGFSLNTNTLPACAEHECMRNVLLEF
jgi:hypothetical protein